MLKIMLQGRKGRGKDTVADMIIQELGSAQRIGFATALKEQLKDLLELELYSYRNNSLVSVHTILDDRDVMGLGWQWYGSLMRKVDQDYWIKQLEKRLLPNNNIIITDCRYQNEAVWGAQNGFYRVKVIGPDRRNIDTRDENHESEINVVDLPCEYVLSNNGSLDDLSIAVQNMLFYAR